jgi:hypothetical protein
MNPYLESVEFWSSLHSRMIVAIADGIAPALRPQYYVDVEKRVYLSRPDSTGVENSLLVGVPDVSVQLKEILEGVYERAGYDLRLDYRQEPQPPLSEEETEWMDVLLKEAGIR